MQFNPRLARRQFLMGAGTSLLIPTLVSLAPRRSRAAAERAAAQAPKRMVLVHLPAGVAPDFWFPKDTGKNFTLSHNLQPLAKIKEQVLLLSNMQNDAAVASRALGVGDMHTLGFATMFTGAVIKYNSNLDLLPSMDQTFAKSIAGQTGVSSLHLALNGQHDGGDPYPGVYSYVISYADAKTPVVDEDQPQRVFDKYFAPSKNAESAAQAAYMRSRRKSILDGVLANANSLRPNLSSVDAQHLDQYFTSVRELENQFVAATPTACNSGTRPALGDSGGQRQPWEAKSSAFMALMTLAFQCDLTRTMTFNFGPGHCENYYDQLPGINNTHHELSHIGTKEQVATIVQWEMKVLARFWEGLQAIPEAGSNMLNNSVSLVTSEIDGHPNNHQQDNIPVLVVGSGGGFISSGRHIRAGTDKARGNLSELQLALLQGLGVNAKSFGDLNVTRAMDLAT